MSAVYVEKEESPRYPIPYDFNPTPYCVFKAVRQLLRSCDRPCWYGLKITFNNYFTKILHHGVNAENEYNDHLKNLPLITMCGNVFDEELDHNLAANSYFLKLALNMLRDYIDSMPKAERLDKVKYLQYDKEEIEWLIERIETYLDYLIDPDSKIERVERVETGGESEGETEEETG